MTRPLAARAVAGAFALVAALLASPAAAQVTVTLADGDTQPPDVLSLCPRANGSALTGTPVSTFKVTASAASAIGRIDVILDPPDAYLNLERVEIQSSTGSTTYASVVPATDYLIVNVPAVMPVGTTATNFRITLVPKEYQAMPPATIGAQKTVRAYVRQVMLTTREQSTGSDPVDAAVTVDNGPPDDVLWEAITAGASNITLDWAGNPQAVVLRRLAAAPTDAPTHGADLPTGTSGLSTGTQVVYNGAAASYNDTPLTGNKPYFYRIFVRDGCFNWSKGVTLGPIFPGGTGEGDNAVNSLQPMVGILNPVAGTVRAPFKVQVRVFSPKTAAGAVQPIRGVRLYADNGVDAATMFDLGTTPSGNYPPASTDSGIFEITINPSTAPTLAPGRWTLRAWARNDSSPVGAGVYSGGVGVVVADPASTKRGDGNLLVRDNSDTLCQDCHLTKSHSSESLGNQLGSWYVGCRTCHQPHNTTNASLIATEITPPSRNGAVPPTKVTYFGKGTKGAGGLAQDSGYGLCQVCHTAPTMAFFKRGVTNETHGDGQECKTCHSHAEGQKTQCTSCHGGARTPAVAGTDTLLAAAPPKSANSNEALRSDTTHYSVGAHEAHINRGTFAEPVHCSECHNNAEHQNMVAGGGGAADVLWGTTAEKDTITPPAWNRAGATCSGVYCHGGTLTGGDTRPTSASLSWVSPVTTMSCTTCHGSGTSPVPTMASSGHPTNTTCAVCHGNAAYTATAVYKPTHVDGTLQAPPTACAKCHGDVATPGTTPVNLTNNLVLAAPGLGTAASSYDTGALAAATRGNTGAHRKHLTSTLSNPGGTASCDQCHDLPPSDLDRTHATGAGTNGARATLAWKAIANGTANAWNSTGTPESPATYTPPTPAYTGSNTATGGTTGGTCANTYCHGNFKNSGKTPAQATVTWTSVTALHCNSCHGTGTTPGNATTPPAPHPSIPVGGNCGSCHTGSGGSYSFTTVAVDSHINGILEVTPVSSATSCTDCHGDSARTAVLTEAAPTGTARQLGQVAPPSDTRSPRSATEQTVYVGAHQPHVNQANGTPLAQPLRCTNCHSAIPTQLIHTAQAMGTNSPTALGTGSSYTPANGATSTQGTCTATYCHGNFRYGSDWVAKTRAVQWGTGAFAPGTKMTCTSCHGATAANPTSPIPGYPHPQNTNCVLCHGAGYASNAVASATHVNRQTTKVTYTCSACHGAVATANPGVAQSANPVNAAPGAAASSYDSAGNADTATTVAGVGAHRAHLAKTNLRTSIPCNQCHTVPAATDKAFADGGTTLTHAQADGLSSRATLAWGNISIGSVSGWSGAPVGPSYTGSTSQTAPAGAGGTCASTYCHGNFRGGKNASVSWTGTFSAVTTACATLPCADTTLTCTSCHGQGTGTAPPAPAHPHPNNAACGSCHNGYSINALNATAKGTHVDGNLTKTSFGCSSCHGVIATGTPGVAVAADLNPINAAPGVTGAAYDTVGAASGKAVGAHAAHLNNSRLRTQKVVCGDCHAGHVALAAGSADTTHAIDAGTGGARAGVAFSTFTTSDHRPTPGTLTVTYAGSNTGTTDTAAGTCTSTYCHGASSPKAATTTPLNGGALKNPGWNSGAAAVACNACHGAPPLLTASGATHSTSTTGCGCHGTGYDPVASTITGAALATHINGSIEASSGACNSCHNAPPTSGVHARHLETGATPTDYAATAGAPTTTQYAFACARCHSGTHQNNGSTPKVVEVVFASPATGTYTPGGTVTPITGPADTFRSTNGTCAATYCHKPQANYTPTNPTWTATTLNCRSCHDGGAAAATTLGGKHLKHVSNATGNYNLPCYRCHYATTNNGTSISDKTKHANSTPDASFNAAAVGTGPTYAQPAAAYAGAGGACSSTYCHSQGQSTTSPFTAPLTTLAWGTGTSSCVSCHAGPVNASNPVMASGKHTNHVNQAATFGRNYVCGACHSSTVNGTTNAPVTSVTNHVNGTKTVAIASITPSGGTPMTGTYSGGACTSTYCHSSGQQTPESYSMAWTATITDCKGCHGRHSTNSFASMAGEPNYTPGAAGSATANSHLGHVSRDSVQAPKDCVKCHTGTATTAGNAIAAGTTHTNGTRNVVIGATYDSNGATSNYNTSTKACSGITCHAAGTPTWGGTVTCSTCHLAPAQAGVADDVDDYTYGNSIAAVIDRDEWTAYGHGRTTAFGESGNVAANMASPADGCMYCHVGNVLLRTGGETAVHGAAGNPFRLANTTGADGKNGACLVCHKTGSTGFDPDGATATYANRNASAGAKISATHYGARHTAGAQGGLYCWDCHDPHGDFNYTAGNRAIAYMFQELPVANHAGATGWGIPTALATAVDFTKTTGTNTTAFDWGDYVKNTATAGTYRGVCQTCHTQTAHYKNNAWVTTPSGDADHNTTAACVSCHSHEQGVNDAFKKPTSCTGCHGGRTPVTSVVQRAAVVNGSAGAEGDDFIRPSHHVSNGTTTKIVTDYDCILCHAEGDVTSTGTTIKALAANHGGDGGATTVDLRNVDSAGGTGIAVAWPGKRLATFTATTVQRDAMDTFCMNCHDANGASTVAVNKTDPPTGMLLPPAAAEATKPFNVKDTLLNAYENGGTTPTLRAWRTTNNKVINVKSQFNSGNAYGKNWASHHNLNQFKLRYENAAGNRSTNNITHWPTAAWTPPGTGSSKAGKTLEGKTLNSGAVDSGFAVGLHCADCHLNESNAHGSRSTQYMLVDKNGTDTLFVATGTTSGTDVCAKCHNPAVYGEGNTDSTSSRTDGHASSGGRCNNIAGGDQPGFASLGYSTTTGMPGAGTSQMSCLGCHGGFGGPSNSNADGTGATNVGPGLIHGTNAAYQPLSTGTWSRMYRFMGTGGSYRYYNPNGSTAYSGEANWTGTGTTGCYTIGSADTWGACRQHSGAATVTNNRARPLEY